ncbi:MAG: beta-lactamase family protein [Acidobacteria bacterium]|nr:beta-lactamase family protein [Acidobacteriota bacterium]
MKLRDTILIGAVATAILVARPGLATRGESLAAFEATPDFQHELLGAQTLVIGLFEQYLESLRQQAGIPGLSGAIVSEGRIVWERGFGYQDLENAVPATPDTPYLIADVSETFAAAILLRCVEHGLVALRDPMRRWTALLPESGATVRHVLSHTSEGEPGSEFRYDPPRFAALTPVAETCAGEPYRKAVTSSILEPLALLDSVPGHDLEQPVASLREMFDPDTLLRYARVIGRLAKPYKVDKRGRVAPSEYPAKGLNAATGLISSARDLARYNAALDDDVLLRPETLAQAWTSVGVTKGGTPVPFGLGWFVQLYNGEQIVWHFGWTPDAFSSLVLKVPGRRLTLILLANSDGLSAYFPLAGGDVTTSLFARLFLRLFL